MAVTLSERFVAQCSPVISSNLATAGSVTRASMAHLNASQLQALYTVGGLFADLDAWFKHSIEMAACGIKRYFLYDWIMANSVHGPEYSNAMKGVSVVKGPSLMHPFILAKTTSVINKDYWKATCGAPVSGYTTQALVANALCGEPTTMSGPLTAAQLAGTGAATMDSAVPKSSDVPVGTDRVVRLQSRYGIPMEANWFLLRQRIYFFSRSSTGKTEVGQWRVLAAAAASDLSFVDVILRDENDGSSAAFDSTPSIGSVVPGVNNVNDYEAWAKNRPSIDPRKRVLFWYQTWRQAREVDQFYLEVYNRLRQSNEAFLEFGSLPMSEINAQDEASWQREFVNSFFFNKAIGPNQTKDLWESLEAVTTAAGNPLDVLSGRLVARRANFIGVKEQLRTCDRVKDLGNNKLNLYELFNDIYSMRRARQGSDKNRVITDIDCWTNATFAAQIQTAMFAYYKAESLDMLQIHVDIGKTVTVDKGMDKNGHEFPITITYNSYPLKFPAGVRLNILVDEAFDDWYDQAVDNSTPSVGNQLLILDIGKPGAGSIYYAKLEGNRKSYTSATIEELAKFDSTYRTVMKNFQTTQTLTSETGTVIVECPLNSLWIDGINEGVPTLTPLTAIVSDIY